MICSIVLCRGTFVSKGIDLQINLATISCSMCICTPHHNEILTSNLCAHSRTCEVWFAEVMSDDSPRKCCSEGSQHDKQEQTKQRNNNDSFDSESGHLF